MADEVGTCIVEGCDRPSKCRGLCRCCYAKALSKVKNYETTWEELERAGLAGPSQRIPNPFGMAYNKLTLRLKDLPGQGHLFGSSPN